MSWSEELLRQVEAAANAAGEAAAEEVWATAIFAANNASRRLQSSVALEAKVQSEQLMQTPPPPPPPHSPRSIAPPPPRVPSPPQSIQSNHRSVSFTDYHHQAQRNPAVITVPQFQHTPPLFIHPLQPQPRHHQTRGLTFIQKISDRFH